MENKDNASLPVMMYVHGFMSGSNGAKQRQLQKQFKGRFRVIAPELDADPDKSLEILNRIIEDEKPEIIVGTSLGGWNAWGSPIWSDLYEIYESGSTLIDTADYSIFGHSQLKRPLITKECACLDTHNAYILSTNGDIEPV